MRRRLDPVDARDRREARARPPGRRRGQALPAHREASRRARGRHERIRSGASLAPLAIPRVVGVHGRACGRRAVHARSARRGSKRGVHSLLRRSQRRRDGRALSRRHPARREASPRARAEASREAGVDRGGARVGPPCRRAHARPRRRASGDRPDKGLPMSQWKTIPTNVLFVKAFLKNNKKDSLRFVFLATIGIWLKKQLNSRHPIQMLPLKQNY